jgi:hypothetical protein
VCSLLNESPIPVTVLSQQLDFWSYGFESRLGHRSTLLVIVVCCVAGHLLGGVLPEVRLIVCLFVCVCVVVCVCVCDPDTSRMIRPRPDLGCCATKKKLFYLSAPFAAVFCIKYTPLYKLLLCASVHLRT